jgi:Arc/MetJ-type ribon-helix-helix transcriptional regulator
MDMILPPITLDDRRHPWWSVNVELPPEMDREIRRYVAEDEFTSWTLVIHDALYLYRTVFWTREQLRAEFEGMIEERSRSDELDEGSEVTPAFWEEFKRRAARNFERLHQLQAEGKVGNLLLPKELYEFVKERIASGDYATPTEVVCAAVAHLRQERETRKQRHEGV